MGNGMHKAREFARVDDVHGELSIRRAALQGEASEKSGAAAAMPRSPAGVAAAQADAAMSDRMVPVAEAAITAMVRIWAARPGRTAAEANELLSGILAAMLSPRERADLVNREIVRRVG